MKISKLIIMMALLVLAVPSDAKKKAKKEALWPNGEVISEWFSDTARVDISTLGRQYVITDFGVVQDSTKIQTEAIQAVIDRAAQDGGGVVVFPKGTFLSGSLFFRQGTYPIKKTRMEGQTLNYFCALVNADHVDGFTISGRGTINGNGLRFWEEFWIRRQFNRQCTNLEALRPRLVYISNSKNVTVQDVHLINSPFWTNHIYNSERIKYLYCTIYAPHEPQDAKAPSSDALDLDVCKDVLVHGCNISVNDDAVVLKGGKGTWADKDPDNGPSSNVLIQKCNYGFVHGCLTLGSESLHDWNVILRDCEVQQATRVLWLKMRPDTPQHYEYVTIENLHGNCGSFLVVRPWTQFFKPEEREDMPLSRCNNITARNIQMDCKNFFDVGLSEKYALKDFTFENINVQDGKNAFNNDLIEGTVVKNVVINGEKVAEK